NIEQYRHHLQNKGFKPRTIALKLTVVRRLYDAAIKLGWVSFNPAINVKPPVSRKQPATNNNYLSEQEAQKLISYLPDDNSLVGLRDRLLVSLMVICGVRQIELHRLTKQDIIPKDDGSVGLKLFAKRSERVIPLPSDVIELLDRYLTARENDARQKKEIKFNKQSPVFISLASNYYGNPLSRRAMQRIANRYLEEAQLKESESRTVTTHGLRHTVGYLMTLAGNSLRTIQDYLGHADPKTTAIYAHIADLWENNPATTINLRLRAT
ncbi:MAG: tyrosine-type recombinase/integrase, partial [Prochloraceae cyanobacterium]